MPADPTPLPGLFPVASTESPAEGRRRVLCSVCNAPLSGREARLWGMGRDCRAKLGLRTGPRQDGHEVEQDGLFE
jgi:hypothetical protein